MKVILEIDEKYAGILSITAVGTSYLETRVATHAVDLSKHSHLVLEADGFWKDEGRAEDGKA